MRAANFAGSTRLEWLWLTGDVPGLLKFGDECLDLAIRTHHHLLRAEVLRHLRRAGRPGLLELIRVLLARPGGRYDLDALKAWIVDQGLERFWNERVAAPGAHELAADLEFAGFERTGTSWKPVAGRTESFFH